MDPIAFVHILAHLHDTYGFDFDSEDVRDEIENYYYDVDDLDIDAMYVEFNRYRAQLDA